jgi:ribokinase
MQDIITIGSAIVDIFVTSTAFELQRTESGVKLCQMYGEKIDADSFELHTGGGGSNTAVAFARAGMSVAVVTETGKDIFAQLVMEDLHKEYVSTNLLLQSTKSKLVGQSYW